MSWYIAATGTKAAVAKYVAEADVHGQTQGEKAKQLIVAVLDTIPTNGVRVQANGHHDAYNANLHIEVTSVRLALDEPDSPAPAEDSAAGEPVAEPAAEA